MCESIMEVVERRAAGRQVRRVTVRVGVLLRAHAPALDQSFALVSEGTSAQGAEICMVVTPVQAQCPGCGWAGETDDLLACCPSCGGTDVANQGGDDLVLESLQLA